MKKINFEKKEIEYVEFPPVAGTTVYYVSVLVDDDKD